MNTSSSFNQPTHLYPRKIALRSQRLIQGSLFYGVIADMSIGQYFSVVPNAEKKMKDLLISGGWSEDTYEISWSCFMEYINEFENPIFQHAVYSIISHWDWYISHLGKFIHFAEGEISPDKKRDNNLLKLNTKPFAEQINIIKSQTGIILKIENEALDLIEEMHLVRNLGLHNQWEVDNTYLKYTKTKNPEIGKKRLIKLPELEKWHSAFLDLVAETSTQLAILYAGAPNYD
jgi:hypothetical protein